MKSEHRHDLQTNELSKLATKASKLLKDQGPSQNMLLGIVIAILLIVTGYVYFERRTRDHAIGWNQLYVANSAEKYANVADDFEGTDVGTWGQLNAAEQNLDEGIRLAFTNRPESIEKLSELKDARKGFESLLDGKSIPKPVRRRALLGTARYLEAVSDGKKGHDEAIAAYQAFVKEFSEESVQKEFAENRIAALSTPKSRKFYKWFYEQTPEPPDRDKPDDGLPSGPSPFGPFGMPFLPPIPDGLYPLGWTAEAESNGPILDDPNPFKHPLESPEKSPAKETNEDKSKEGNEDKSKETKAGDDATKKSAVDSKNESTKTPPKDDAAKSKKTSAKETGKTDATSKPK